MSERRISTIEDGGLTADIERPTISRSRVGCATTSPGTSISTCPTIAFWRSSLRTRFSPISDTYQCEPSGSSAMSWGLALGPNPSVWRLTRATSACRSTSMTDTEAPFWLVT